MSTVAKTCTLLKLIVRAIVTDDDAVAVTLGEGSGKETVFYVRVGPNDRGKIIGKQGRIARSLRIILSAMAKKDGRRYILDIDGRFQCCIDAERVVTAPLWCTGNAE